MSLKGFPQNIDISPDNWRDLKITKDFSNRRNGVTIEIGDFKLQREGFEAALDWLATYGKTESPEAYFTTPPTTQNPNGTTFDLFMDVKSWSVGLDDVSSTLEFRKSNNHFFEEMTGLSWQEIRQQGFITDQMLIDFPYLVVPDDLRAQKALQIATLASILFQLYITVKEVADTAAIILNPTNAAVFAVQIVSLGAYLALTVASLIDTAVNLQQLYFPFVRYFKCISDLDLMRAACEYKGYTFVSDFMTNERAGVYTIGRPDPSNTSTFDELDNFFASNNIYLNLGYPRSYDTGGQYAAELFDHYLQNYDVDLFVYNGVVRLERSSYFDQTATVNVKPTLTDPESNDDRYAFNEGDTWGRKYFRWSNDENDAHSKDVNKGSVRFEAITTAVNVVNQDLVSLTGLKEYFAPFALVKRKNGYTKTETFVKIILQDISNILVQFGLNNPAFEAFATERIGVGIFEKDYWTVTRKVWGKPEFDSVTGRTVLRQPSDYLNYLSQTEINNTFNTGLYVENNTFEVKALKNLPFTGDNFESLLQNNRVNYAGESEGAKVWIVEWYPFKYYCDMTVELPSDAGNNTQVTIL